MTSSPIKLSVPIYLISQIKTIAEATNTTLKNLLSPDNDTTLNEKINAICSKNKLDIHPITEISLPQDFEDQASEKEQNDILTLFGNVANTNESLEKIKALNAPKTITRIYEERLRVSVEALETNNLQSSEGIYHIKDKDSKRILRSLNDIGYSLVKGWIFKDYETKGAN